MSEDPLDTLRLAIDRADEALLDTLAARLKVVKLIAEIKHVSGVPGVDPSREAQLAEAWRMRAVARSIPPDLAEGILSLVLAHTRTMVTGEVDDLS